MQQCGVACPSTMAAVLGLDERTVETICAETGAEVANVNAPGQVGISGPVLAVQRASALARERGARRVLPLNVSAAFHSSVMEPAAQQLAKAVATTPIVDATIPLVANVDAMPIMKAADLRRELVEQLTRTVRWQQTIEFLAASGITRLYEVGTGTVLCGLAKRIAPQLEAENPVETALGRERAL